MWLFLSIPQIYPQMCIAWYLTRDKVSKMDQVKFAEDSLQKFEGVWSVQTEQQTMWMSSANFTWSILEYFALYNQAEIPRLSLVVPYILHYYCILVLTKIIIRWCKNYTFIPDSIIYITVLYLLINFLWNYPTSLHSFYFPSLLCDSTTAVKCYKSITIGIWIYLHRSSVRQVFQYSFIF